MLRVNHLAGFGSFTPAVAGGGETRTDDFNRANSGTLGSNWSSWTANTFQIFSNEIFGNNSSQTHMDYWSADSFNSDHYSEVDYTTVGNSSNGGGPMIRGQAGVDGYRCYNTSAAPQLRIYRIDNSSETELTNTSQSITGGDTMRLEASGSTITLDQNTTERLNTTDSTYTGGSPGVYCFNNLGGWDNWAGSPTA